MARIAQVAVSGLNYSFDRIFDYELPREFDAAAPGCRVLVDFANIRRPRTGIITRIYEGEPEIALKPVRELIDSEPLLTPDRIEAALKTADRSFCCLYDALNLFLPSGLAYRESAVYSPAPGASSDDAEKRKVLEALKEKPLTRAGAARLCGAGAELLEEMAREGLLVCENKRTRKVGDKTVRMLSLAPDALDENGAFRGRPTKKQLAVLEFLRQKGDSASKEITYSTGCGASVLNTLIHKGLLTVREQLCYREAYTASERRDPDGIVLQEGQRKALEELSASQKPALLYGVTGSGKTMVILKLAARVLKSGRTVLITVPEILLTPQFTKIFSACFGSRVAILHSGLSEGVRLDEYRRIARGEATLVIGTRSSVFAPLENIGLIAMDEEQDGAYKSESSPRYDAAEVALIRAAQHRAKLVFMSATPSVRTRYLAETGKLDLVRMSERYAGAQLPKVTLVDMREEKALVPGGVIGATLLGRLEETWRQGRQAVLLLNRRGHDTVVICDKCSKALSCPNCSVALNYHTANGRLMCHCCGYSRSELVCPVCGGSKMRFLGSGIQKAEQELGLLLPQARVLRMDTDTAVTREAHDRLFSRFAGGEYDILIGTQMVAKGLDFENVTLSGVLNGEQGLFSGDIYGAERTFSLLTQVAGRCGRGRYPGEAVIQTYMPENRIYEYAVAQDYESFYRGELELRRQMFQPPFCDLCLLGVSAASPELAESAADELRDAVKEALAAAGQPVIGYGPAPAHTAKAAGRYRFRLTLKVKNSPQLRAAISGVLRGFMKKHARGSVSVFAQLNPDQIY